MKRQRPVPGEWKTLWPISWHNCDGCREQARWEKMYRFRKYNADFCENCYMLLELQKPKFKGEIICHLACSPGDLRQILAAESK